MEKIWLKNYPAGVPADIDVGALRSLNAFFEESVQSFGSRVAFVSGSTGVSLTYKDLDEKSRHFAAYFQQHLKLEKGARVAVMMPNVLQYPICLFGLLRAGYVIVNVNPQYTARELEYQLKDSDSAAMVVVDLYAATLEKIIANTSVRHVVVTGLADMMPKVPRWLANFVIHQVKKLVVDYKLPKSVLFRDALRIGAAASFSPVTIEPNDLAFLQYTGGTTGVSKGAMLTHRNVLANVTQVQNWIEPFLDKTQKLTSITPIPLYHIYAMSTCFSFVGLGGTNVLVADPRNMTQLIKILRKYPFVSLPGVNTLFQGLVNHPDFAKLNFSTLRVAIGGGAPVQPSVAKKWLSITKSPLVEGYGLTECSPIVTVNPFDVQEFSGSIGLPLPSTEVSIRNADGEQVQLGEAGELCVRGPQVMLGYWRRPEETLAVMTADGYLKTGDMAVMNDGGFIKIVDRIKDMILVSGFNVYPSEVEQVVLMLSDVAEVAAIGVPCATSGERIKIYVVKKVETLTKEAILNHCRANLTAYKMPHQIEFLPELPKSNVGKILRRALRDLTI